jgi:hypothetical protein
VLLMRGRDARASPRPATHTRVAANAAVLAQQGFCRYGGGVSIPAAHDQAALFLSLVHLQQQQIVPAPHNKKMSDRKAERHRTSATGLGFHG